MHKKSQRPAVTQTPKGQIFNQMNDYKLCTHHNIILSTIVQASIICV